MGLKTLCEVTYIAHWQKGWVKLGKRRAQLQVGILKLASLLNLTQFFCKGRCFSLDLPTTEKQNWG